MRDILESENENLGEELVGMSSIVADLNEQMNEQEVQIEQLKESLRAMEEVCNANSGGDS